MKSWNMIIDVARCHDCNDCFLADKDEFVGNDFPPYSAPQPWHGHRWMNIERKERGQYPIVQTAYLPTPCMHCDEAPCLTADGAVYKREDGLVIIDPVKAKGRKEIVATCPYGVIYWNEELELPQKCTGCAHLLDDGWTETRCSQVCPTEAIKLVVAEDAEFDGARGRARASSATAAASAPSRASGTRTCTAGRRPSSPPAWCAATTTSAPRAPRMSVARGGQACGEAAADLFGEVLVDKLEPGAEYEVTIALDGYEPAHVHGDPREEPQPRHDHAGEGLRTARRGAPPLTGAAPGSRGGARWPSVSGRPACWARRRLTPAASRP